MSSPTLARPQHAAADWTIPQDWEHFTPLEHNTWDRLFVRQAKVLQGRAVAEFLDGIQLLGMDAPGIPRFDDLSERLMKLTGWQVVAVPGLIPDEEFFDHLANRRFVSGNFIRAPEQLDYLQEPDVFHDVYGHVPMLAHPQFADYMQAYGEGGLRAAGRGQISKLARLYWYTVEFGLIERDQKLQIYGAGIASSPSESVFSLEDASPNRLGFDVRRLLQTKYRIDDFQQTYFVIESFEDLLRKTQEADFGPIYDELSRAADIEIDMILPTDKVYTRGTQAYARRCAVTAVDSSKSESTMQIR